MSLQERLEIIRSSPVPRNEESAKFQILAPILQNLGWDPSEILPEHAVGGRGGGRADFALKSSNRIVVLIEAKAPGLDLRGHVVQVLGYAFHEGVDICVLTTGLEWWLYLPRESGRPSERRFAVLNVMDDPVEQLLEDFDTFLSRETLVSGQAEQRARLVLRAQLEAAQLNKEIPSIWKEMLEKADEELVDLLSNRVYEKVNLRPTKAQVVAALRGSPIPSTAIPADTAAAPPAPAPSDQDQPAQWWRSWGKPTAIQLWGKRYPVSTHIGAMRKFVDLLYERHHDDFDRVLKVRGGQYPHAARDPDTLAPSYPRHQPMSSGCFVALSNNPEDIKRRVGRLLECFDYDASDFKLLYD